MGEAFIYHNYSSCEQVYAWRIRPSEPAYYTEWFGEAAGEDSVDIDVSIIEQGDVDNPNSPFYGLSVNQIGWFYKEQGKFVKDGYDYAFYKNCGRIGLDETPIGVEVNIRTFKHPEYADWEFKISTDPNLYPTDYSTIEINGVEYECDYLGIQDFCINATEDNEPS